MCRSFSGCWCVFCSFCQKGAFKSSIAFAVYVFIYSYCLLNHVFYVQKFQYFSHVTRTKRWETSIVLHILNVLIRMLAKAKRNGEREMERERKHAHWTLNKNLHTLRRNRTNTTCNRRERMRKMERTREKVCIVHLMPVH